MEAAEALASEAAEALASEAAEEVTSEAADEVQDQEQFARAEQLRERVTSTPWRMGMGPAYLVPDTATTYSEYTGEGEYATMFGVSVSGERSGVDLTRWLRGSVGERQTLILEYLRFYPMIHLPEGRMVWARIARTRITYVKHGVNFPSAFEIGGRGCYLSLAFPDRLENEANIVIGVRGGSESNMEHRIGLQFDGFEYRILWDDGSLGATDVRVQGVLAELGHPTRGQLLLQRLLTPVKFYSLGRDDKNAADFFGHRRHELKLIDFGDAHVFVADRQRSPWSSFMVDEHGVCVPV